MPIIAYVCEQENCKDLIKKFYRSAKDSADLLVCKKCNNNMKKSLSSPSTLSKIVIDNGIQARSVEIIPNIIELNEEKSNKNYREEE